MHTHLIDSQLARFRTNPLEPFDKVNIGIKSILASRVIQPKNLANALDHHNICSRVFMFSQIRKSMDLGLQQPSRWLYKHQPFLLATNSIYVPYASIFDAPLEITIIVALVEANFISKTRKDCNRITFFKKYNVGTA